MGLDAYLYYQCGFRRQGEYGQIQHLRRSLSMLQVMLQHVEGFERRDPV